MEAVYAGLDLGSTSCEVVVKTKAGERILHRPFPTGEAGLRSVIGGIPGKVIVNLEASELSGWAARILWSLDNVEKVVVSNPKTNAWIARDPLKNDGRDADKLCDQVRLGIFDEVYCPKDDQRAEFKQLVQHYDSLTREEVRLKNQIKGRYRLQGIIVQTQDVYTSEGRAAYLSRVPSAATREAIGQMYCVLDVTLKAQKDAHKLMAREGKKYPEIGLFLEMPGIGPVSACRFSSYIQTPHRFRTARKLVRYCQLGITDRVSDGKSLGYRRLDKNGNGRLKDLSRKAFMHAMKYDNAFSRAYRRTLARTHNETHARLTVQRKILTTMWAMWKGGVRYDDRKG